MNKIALITRRTWLSAAAAALAIFATTPLARADVPPGWKTFKGAFFEIGIPPGFVATAIKTGGNINAVLLFNKALNVEFAVFSPQWDGEAPFKGAHEGEKVVARNVKKTGKETAEDISIEAKDGSYTRYVLSQTFADEANSTHTNKTFGIRVPNTKVLAQVKNLYAQWKKTLTQLGD